MLDHDFESYYALLLLLLGTLSTNVDATSLPQSPLDTEDSPSSPPLKQSSDDDVLHSPKLLESREPQQSEENASSPSPYDKPGECCPTTTPP